MSRAQVIFALALATITVLVVVVGSYIASTTFWGKRWYGRPGQPTHSDRDREGQP